MNYKSNCRNEGRWTCFSIMPDGMWYLLLEQRTAREQATVHRHTRLS